MRRSFQRFGVTLLAASFCQMGSAATSSAGPWPTQPGLRRQVDTITQIAALEQLSRGQFDGTTTVGEVQRRGDFGIGTFNGLDGEMVVLDGVVYQAPSNGHLRVVAPNELVPFATLTKFRAERSFASSGPLADYASLQVFLTNSMPNQDEVLALRVHGTFGSLKLRAPRKQVKPYPTLTEALKAQAVFDLTSISGTLVGFRFPAYVGTTNVAGYHFHFVSDDRRAGGHVLEVSTGSVVATAQTIERWDITVAAADRGSDN